MLSGKNDPPLIALTPHLPKFQPAELEDGSGDSILVAVNNH
jgi:hypothetical protein